MSEEKSPMKYMTAGAFGGLCTVISGHPLDTIKVRLQIMPGKYTGTWDALTKIVAQEGPLSLYKGLSAPLITVVPMFASSFLGFGYGKHLVADPGQTQLSNSQLIFAGSFSGASTAFITVPAERIKCLLQMQGEGPKKYDGFFDCAIKLWREGGIRNLYIGTGVTLLRDLPSTGVYFCSYERILQYLLAPTAEVTWQPFVAGGFAGMINWVLAMPPDVVKSRLQTSPFRKYPHGGRSAFAEIVREEGYTAFYKGIVPVMLRAFPANAACFLGLEMALKFFDLYVPWL